MAQSVTPYNQQLLRELEAVPDEYLPALLEIIRAYRQSVTLKSAEDSFRQGWREVLAGETKPLSDLWKGIDTE